MLLSEQNFLARKIRRPILAGETWNRTRGGYVCEHIAREKILQPKEHHGQRRGSDRWAWTEMPTFPFMSANHKLVSFIANHSCMCYTPAHYWSLYLCAIGHYTVHSIISEIWPAEIWLIWEWAIITSFHVGQQEDHFYRALSDSPIAKMTNRAVALCKHSASRWWGGAWEEFNGAVIKCESIITLKYFPLS